MARNRHKVSRAVPEQPDKTQAFFDLLESKVRKEKTDFHLTSNGEKQVTTSPVAIRHKAIAWGFPLDEVVYSKWFVALLAQDLMPWDTYITTESTYLPDARNTIHADFLQTGLEWLVMLDSDVIPPRGFLHRLLIDKKPMVGGWYRKKTIDPALRYPVVYTYSHTDEKGVPRYDIRQEPGKGLEKVEAAGAGVWLMHRSVALAIGESPYNMERGGEDLELCRKVYAAGFEIWIDWEIDCGHTGVGIY